MTTTSIHTLTATDAQMLRAMLDLFGQVFDEPETYGGRQPDASRVPSFVYSATAASSPWSACTRSILVQSPAWCHSLSSSAAR